MKNSKQALKDVTPVLTETFSINQNDVTNQGGNVEQRENSTNFRTFTKDPSPRNSVTPIHQNYISVNNESRVRNRSSEETLKHYDGQTNLLDLKPGKKRNSADDVFETLNLDDMKSSQAALPPIAPRRYRRHPTIENAVCLQEVCHVCHL